MTLNKKIDIAALIGKGEPVIRFDHKFFGTFEDLYFRMSESGDEAVICFKLASVETVLGLEGVKREFKIADDTHDGQMLDVVREALQFVKGLRLGDPIPKEIVSREASWEPTERHRRIAYQRLTLQLVTWLTGEEHLITDPEQILQIADDPAIKAKVNKAFEQAAAALGKDARKEDVVLHIVDLSKEFSYIEALRDRFEGLYGVVSVEQKLQGLRRLYSADRGLRDTFDQVTRLCNLAVKQYREMFEEIDAQTGEIMAVLKNVEAQVAYAREMRDALYIRLLAWNEILAEWRYVEVRRTEDKPDVMRRIYQFLAPRFMQTNQWVLLTKPMTAEDMKKLSARQKQALNYKSGITMKW